MIGIARETLVLRRGGILPPLSLLIPTFAFPWAPAAIASPHSTRMECAPTDTFFNAIPRLRCLPYTRLLSTPGPSTSELLRTL